MTTSRHVMDPFTLTAQLNALLQAIHLPFVLYSPVDLTPSLLILILESILGVPIPIAYAIDKDDENRHIHTIKVFLGVLEIDVLQTDIGLSNLDPRLLAVGAWHEVVYVAEVLCWIGEELGLIQPVPSRASPSIPIAPTPSPSSTITFLPPFTEFSPPPTPTTTALLFSTDMDDHTLQTNITSPLTTSSLRQLPSSHSSPHKPSNPMLKKHTKPRSAHLSSSHTAISTCVHSHLHSSPHLSVSVHDIPRDDSWFSRPSPSIRRTGYISSVSSPLEHSLSSSTSSSGFSVPTSAPQRSSGHKDWRRFLSNLPDHNPRRTYELLEELLCIRMSQRQSF